MQKQKVYIKLSTGETVEAVVPVFYVGLKDDIEVVGIEVSEPFEVEKDE